MLFIFCINLYEFLLMLFQHACTFDSSCYGCLSTMLAELVILFLDLFHRPICEVAQLIITKRVTFDNYNDPDL